ncbi:hypothetical protein DRV85_01380 [Rhodosalinus halophilus]|uniref:SPOR domain-containing protein n=1 Tax=Rhodosalinus halophilus TaxID=2259333 RepID=A0A365UDI9_9RHOB|nr:SPOR domain-containing protein [Rhodosalinus halophilus]RBI87606.1 hypothetical protein DRV85_01380 [Rhodosalinus halophilus]
MTLKTVISRGALGACLVALAVPGLAQTLDTAGPPAEFPPESYEGRQYVDSRGCVYIRAGVDGDVTWVPRVNRDREQLCGFQPTFAEAPEPTSQEPAAPQEPEVAESTPAEAEPERPEPQQEATPAPTETAAAPQRTEPRAEPPAQRPARTRIQVPRRAPQPAPRATADPIETVASLPAGQAQPSQRPARSGVVAAPQAAADAGCPGGSALSRGYLVAREGERLRCGPQARPPYSFRIIAASEVESLPEGARVYRYQGTRADGGMVYRSVSGRPVSGEARVLPRHLWQPPEPASAQVEVPEGYEPAWKDGRLNPRRAEQTLDGRAEMLLIWTNTTPRRLVDRASGEDVTAQHPRLFYPFTDLATQNAYLAAKDELQVRVASDGRVRLVPKPEARETQVAARPTPAAQQAAPTRAPEATGPAHRFVQVGTFGVPSNARRTAARLQSMGLPVRLAPMTRGGKRYQVVLAGPFDNRSQVQGALGRARQAGFHDAFPRN